ARASAGERRAAHRAYAAALTEPARRAWHAAAGALEPDEAIAAALAATATASSERGGHAAAAAALEQAARLSPDRATAAERRRAAAEAAWLAGDGPRALSLLDATPAARESAEATHLRGRVLARRGPLPAAVAVLAEGGRAVAGESPGLAAVMLAEASNTAQLGRGVADEMTELAREAAALAPADDPRARCLAAIALGTALVMLGDPAAAAQLEEATTLIDSTPALRNDVRLAALPGIAAAYQRGGTEAYAPLERAIARARDAGAIGVLPLALFYAGVGALSTERWNEAAAYFEESLRLARETGLRVDGVHALAGMARLEARRGEAAAAGHAATALALAREFGMPFMESWALQAQGEIAWALDDLEGALERFAAKEAVLAANGMRDPDLSPAPEIVAVLTRLGRDEEAARHAARAAEHAELKGRPWALARARRAQALVAPDAEAVERFAEALKLHATEPDVFERARTQLDLGERQRRAGRRAEAREPLRDAHQAFAGLAAGPWTERAAAELEATGETARRRDASTLDDLTPQELRIAQMLAGGRTTRQTAAALYLSPKTIEYHLRHVYLKLGINSRAALAEALVPAAAAGRRDPVATTDALPARG
ncbi:MAG: hypothetical protein QOE28_132, partial [Solirubrobacteraceae bacterium]|nr:hypothetical protein [Solirubrobacteraceae bacterium]